MRYAHILGFWIVWAMAASATNTSAAQTPSPTPPQTLPESAGRIELWFGFISAVIPHGDDLWFLYLNTAVTYESDALWLEFSTVLPVAMLDFIGGFAEFLADDLSPPDQLPLAALMNPDDGTFNMMMFGELSARATVMGRGEDVLDVGGVVVVERFFSTQRSAVNGVTVAPAFGYRHVGDTFRASAAVFVGPRFDHDSLDGAALGIETMLRLAPAVGFGGYAKARGQMLLLADADNQGNSGAIPMVFAEIGMLYRW